MHPGGKKKGKKKGTGPGKVPVSCLDCDQLTAMVTGLSFITGRTDQAVGRLTTTDHVLFTIQIKRFIKINKNHMFVIFVKNHTNFNTR